MQKKIKIIAMGMIVMMFAAVMYSDGNCVRLLSAQEANQVKGGVAWIPICAKGIKVIAVVASICTIADVGWQVIKTTWDDADPGVGNAGRYIVPTQIRQQTSGDGGASCFLTENYDEVYEAFMQ